MTRKSLLKAFLIEERDRGCVGPELGAPGFCRGWLEMDHFFDEGQNGMSMRATDDPLHTQILCWYHHHGGWATSKEARQKSRERVRRLEAEGRHMGWEHGQT